MIMTTVLEPRSQTMAQKSATVSGSGPCAAMYSLGLENPCGKRSNEENSRISEVWVSIVRGR